MDRNYIFFLIILGITIVSLLDNWHIIISLMTISYIAGILNYNNIGLMELFNQLVNSVLVSCFIRPPPDNTTTITNTDRQIVNNYRPNDPIEEAGLGVIMGVSTLLRDVTSLINGEIKNQHRLNNVNNDSIKIEDVE